MAALPYLFDGLTPRLFHLTEKNIFWIDRMCIFHIKMAVFHKLVKGEATELGAVPYFQVFVDFIPEKMHIIGIIAYVNRDETDSENIAG